MSKSPQTRKIIRPVSVQILLAIQCLFVSSIFAQDSANLKLSDNLKQLEKENFVVGISQVGVRENSTNFECSEELSIFLDSVKNKKVWAIKLIDSFGHAPKSFVWGNYFWFSSRELCNDINDPFKMSLSPWIPRTNNPALMNETSPFPVRFQVVFFNFTSPMYVDIKLQFEHIIHVGLCIPDSCSQEEILKFTRYYFGNKTFETQNLYDIKMREIGTKVPGYQWSFVVSTGVVIFFSCLFLVITFCVLAEVITRLHSRSTDLKKGGSLESNSSLESFLLCFSLRENMRRIARPENPNTIMPVITGLRTIVCLWVTMFHVYYYSLYTIQNIPIVFSKLEGISLQPVLQSCFYVDVFFVISAFLLVHNFFSNTAGMQTIRTNRFIDNFLLFLKHVLHRYCRLMPVFFVTMVLSDIMFNFLDLYAPFKMDESNGLYCKETWWYNALFINNFLDLRYICSSWSWYLGCEMQFFIFFLFLLFVFAKNESLGKIAFLSSAVIFIVVSFCCNYYYGITFQADVIYNTIEHLYVKPWVRINPYFGGAFMGWLYYKTKATGITISNVTLRVFWTISIFVYLTTIFMSYWKNSPVWLVSTIMSFGKTLFGLFIGTIIFLCQHGYGGVFNTVMGCKLFLHLNKFCFSVYMLAPILVATIFGVRMESTTFDELASAMDFIGILISSYGVAVLAILLMEIPFQRISSKFVLKRA